jgi:hypothetical protein
MNGRMLLPMLLMFSFLMLNAKASCGTVPSGVLYCAQLQLTNGQASGTGTNFAQLFHLNALSTQGQCGGGDCLASTLKNIVIYNKTTGTINQNCEIEGNENNLLQKTNLNTAINIGIWCKIPESLAGSGATNQNYYVGFASPSVDELAAGNIGEVANLSSSYGAYDNGANIFSAWWDFAGVTLPSGLTGCYGSVNNGITWTTGGGWCRLSTTSSYNPQTQVVDYIGYYNGTLSTNFWKLFGFDNGDWGIYESIPTATAYNLFVCGSNCGAYATFFGHFSQTVPSVFSSWTSPTAMYASENYSHVTSQSADWIYGSVTSTTVSMGMYGYSI